MISDIVYLYGDNFATETNILHFRETLFNGKKVDQKKLAQQLIFAALVSLYQDKVIDLFIEEGKILFIKTKTAKAKRLTDAKGLEGLEKQLFTNIKDTEAIKVIVRLSLHIDENPWGEVSRLVRKQLDSTKSRPSEKEIEKRFNEYSATIGEIKKKGELFTKMHEAIREGIEAREEKEETENE